MKRLLSIALAVCMLFGNIVSINAETLTAAPTAQWAEENGWTTDGSGYTKTIDNVNYSLFYGWIKSENYDLDEPRWQISTTSSPEAKGVVEIPSFVDGFPVTSIGKMTFSYNDSVTECKIPEGIELISESAFYNCKCLQKVSLPDTLIMIDLMAFYSCPVLTELTIPASVGKIARNAFLRNTTTQEGLETLIFLGDAPKIAYAAEENGYSLANLDGVKIYIQPDRAGWDQVVWTKYDLHDMENKFSYVDVEESDWFYESVCFGYDKQIMTGLDENRFGPYKSLSRAQFMVILYRMSKTPDVEYEKVFEDVADGNWYTDAIIWAKQKGIIYGYENGCFGVDHSVTREEVVTILYRYAKYIGCDTENKREYTNFKDAEEVSSFASEAMSWAVAHEIIVGKENGTSIDPQGMTARAEGAAIIQRFLKMSGEIA